MDTTGWGGRSGWVDVRPEARAAGITAALCGTPRERWKAAYRRERLIQKQMWRQIVAAGEVGTMYGVRLVQSPEIRG